MENIFNFNINNEKTLTRILIYELRDRNKDSVRFVVNDSAVNSLLLYLKTKSFDTILYVYGYLFIMELLKYFEELENYEDCQLIINAIKEYNKIKKEVNDEKEIKI